MRHHSEGACCQSSGLPSPGVEGCHRPTRPISFVTPGAQFNLVTQLPDFLFAPIAHTICLYFIPISSASSVLFPSPDISLNILRHHDNWNNIIVCRPLVFSFFEAAPPEPHLSLAVAEAPTLGPHADVDPAASARSKHLLTDSAQARKTQ